MLPELLYREWILNRTTVLLTLAIFVAFNAYSVLEISSARVYMVFACLYSAFLTVSLFVREDKFRATGWTCTLPVTRWEIVRARFLAAWLLIGSALALAVLLAALLPSRTVSVAGTLEPSTLLIAATIATVVVGLMLPFTIRFGLLGVMIFLVGAQILGVSALLLTKWARQTSSGSGRPIEDTLAPIGNAIVALREMLSFVPFALLVLVVLALANYLGYRLTVALFQRQEF